MVESALAEIVPPPNIKINRFFLPSWDRLDGTFVMFLPKNMKPSTLQREINNAYKKFYGPRQIFRRFREGDIWCGLKRMAYSYWAWEIRRRESGWTSESAGFLVPPCIRSTSIQSGSVEPVVALIATTS